MEGALNLVPLAVAGLGGIALLWSFRDGRAGNLMFDGASICKSTIAPTLYHHLPAEFLQSCIHVLYLYITIL